MKKIPTVFMRSEDRRSVIDEVTPGCEWVLAGEGTPTRKFDGTCTMFDGRQWWARREVKMGKREPYGWVHSETDEATGKRSGGNRSRTLPSPSSTRRRLSALESSPPEPMS